MHTRSKSKHTLAAVMLVVATSAAADYACPPASDKRGGWVPEACVQAICADCGVVESVTKTDVDADASGLGAAAGAVAGGLIGNQIGKGKGRTLATVIGAVGGGVAGHYGEKKLRGKTRWDVVVVMEDGSRRTLGFDQEPAYRAGDKVKVSGDTLSAY